MPTTKITPEDVARYPYPGLSIPTGIAFSPDDALITYLHSAEGTLTQQLYAFDPATNACSSSRRRAAKVYAVR